ncbi:MAG: hypothetical protein M3P38_02690 [Chloroflexota bacterium]|nr:hypothetical protein [Chloroflexota bacterium]
MSRQRFIVAAALVGLVVLTIGLVISSLANVRIVAIDSFQRTADTQKIVLNVTIGLGDELVERTVDEDERTVKITVRIRQPLEPRDLLGVAVPVLVSLKRPLGDRAVVDHDGRTVRDLGSYLSPGPTR